MCVDIRGTEMRIGKGPLKWMDGRIEDRIEKEWKGAVRGNERRIGDGMKGKEWAWKDCYGRGEAGERRGKSINKKGQG